MPSFRSISAGILALAIHAATAGPVQAEGPATVATIPHPYAYGILVGSNAAGPGQPGLRYAEGDARRMAEVFRELGRYGKSNLRVLTSPASARVLATIDDIGQNLREHQQ